jgi:hypothetical protein
MGHPDLDRARGLHAALHDVFFRDGDWTDRALLARVLSLCREAADAVSDAYCREELNIVGDYATELFSEASHGRYESDSLSGAEFLRLQILKALDSFHSRLFSMEAVRRATELARLQPPPTGSRGPRL